MVTGPVECITLDSINGAMALCALDGAVLSASHAASDILRRLGTPDQIPDSLWSQLEGTVSGESVIVSPTDRAGVLGCTRFPVGTDRALVVMREINLQHDLLSQQLQRHRAKTTELLVLLLAHDLRTPLASIVFNLDVLRGRWDELDTPAAHQCLEESQSAADELRGTIDILLDLVRVGPPRATTLGIRSVIDRVVALTRPLFRQAGHELVVRIAPETPPINANGVAVQQILVNLLINAVEASTKPIAIELTAEPAPDGRARLRVRDFGPGISPEVQARLFQPFFTTKTNGTGLGLALARDTAVSEHGTLDYIPGDQGACFEVLLPAGKQLE